MNCLLIAATSKEIEPFLNYYRQTENRDIDVLITGVGAMATNYRLLKQLELKRPEMIVQAGIAGCFDKKIALGTVLAIRKDTIADESVVENKELKTVFDLGFASPDRFPYYHGWLVNKHTDLLKKIKLKAVSAVSVNHITTSRQMINFYTGKFKPETESMEGAALHYIALQEKIPFLQLRAVSNYIGERNKTKWKIKDAVINLNRELIRFFESL